MQLVKSVLALAGVIVSASSVGPAHADRFETWSDLLASHCYTAGATKDYDIESIDRANNLLVMAIHGGDIEPFTKELASEVAGFWFWFSSYYALDGHNKRNGCSVGMAPAFFTDTEDLHIDSSDYDEPIVHDLATSHDVIVSIHGMRDRNDDDTNFPQYAICVGGKNDAMRDSFIELVRADPDLDAVRVIDAVYPREPGGPLENDDGVVITQDQDRCADDTNPLSGTASANPVNLGSGAGGLQLEMSMSLRRALYGLDEDGDAPGPWVDHDDMREALVAIIREVMLAQ